MDFPRSGLRVEGTRLLIVRPPRPIISVDVRLLDEVSAARPSWLGRALARAFGRAGQLELRVGRLRVALDVADGPLAAARLAAALGARTRDAPITDVVGWEDARRRLDAALAGRVAPDAPAVLLGGEPVRLDGDAVLVGGVRFLVHEVRLAAARGDNLSIVGGVELQAAFALLLVAAEERRALGDDVGQLRRRIADYERATGRSAGR